MASSDYGLIILIVILILCLIVFILDRISNGIIGEKRKNQECIKELRSIEANLNAKEALLNNREAILNKKEKRIAQAYAEFKNITSETSQEFPYLASLIAEWKYKTDAEIVQQLKRKTRPALKAAEEVKSISREKRLLNKKCEALEHQIKFYESLFPWLEDFKELPPAEAFKYVSAEEEQDEYTSVKDWLSPEEYSKLPSVQKWQLALDRYVNRKSKTNWHIGIEYERYIGYMYETKGFRVIYSGALQGLEDRGRDILVERDTDVLVIQCKRWSKDKLIHEKHIMQLFGSVAALSMESTKQYRGVFITSTILSDTAKHFAKLLNIEVVENYKFRPYPLIKCNISQTGERIYHLPFDQQYDRIHMELDKGNCYVQTVAEAEEKGFRHAYRWHGAL